ncbi:MAG: transporter substrate-binding domain-containing protein [Clostridia bacterium]|nr:transporter substrate-binding domain-containing protein [Clostridia bacterium]
MKNFMKILALALVAVMAVACFAACNEKTDGKVYKIASDNAFAPFEYLDPETNTYVGVDMDIMAAIAEDQGFKYEMANVGFDAALGQVQAGQADGVIAGMTIKPEREEIFDFSNGYFEDGQIMVVAANSDIDSLEDLAGKVVATKAGTMGLEFAEANKEKYGYTTTMFEGSVEMYQAVAQGSCVACFEDRAVIGTAIKNGEVDLKTVGEVINPAPYGFAVNKGQNPELIEMFNKGLENIKANGKYDEILAKYGM